MAVFNGTPGNDTLRGTRNDDQFNGGAGDDDIFGGSGSDTVFYNAGTDGADEVILGIAPLGGDVFNVTAALPNQVRLTFTSAEVGNNVNTDSGALANQDGGLAVRLQAEDASDGLTGPVTRVEDENVIFVAGEGVKFDVRDLVSGAERGEGFDAVQLATSATDIIDHVDETISYYINGGIGDDRIRGSSGGSFLVGGAGNDTLIGGPGDDSFIGGGGNDAIFGGNGDDIAIFNISTDGADSVTLGAATTTAGDVIQVNANAATQVRLTFTSAEVGNRVNQDSGAMANQDGGLAVRMQAEDGSDGLTGPITRVEDENISFVAGAGVKFDVRDLVSGTQRGNMFDVVTLGSIRGDVIDEQGETESYYINGGMGDDVLRGGSGENFLVGGGGNDTLLGSDGGDSFIGGGGDDVIAGGMSNDIATFNVSSDGADSVILGNTTSAGGDVLQVNASAATEVRLTFTSAEVGDGVSQDSGALANQDGALAVRLQAEDGADGLTGPTTRVEDEDIIFVAGEGVKFDVRDLVSGTQRGNMFDVVQLGSLFDDNIDQSANAASYYINGGMGADVLRGGTSSNFLVGGGGADTLLGGDGGDSFIGGGGDDVIAGGMTNDIATFNVSTDGADSVILGSTTSPGGDVFQVNANSATQVRLTFTSSEVGDGVSQDSNTMTNQDGALAVRLQAEDGSDALTGPVTRVEDEDIIFVAGAGVKFDVRDLPSGTERGDGFDAVQLGSTFDDVISQQGELENYYINTGMGNDDVSGGAEEDFLVGGGGDDTLDGIEGRDSALGGGGDDLIYGGLQADSLDGGDGDDRLIAGEGTDTVVGGVGIDRVEGGTGKDDVNGGEGNDSLFGDEDRDTMTGGAGEDRFAFKQGDFTGVVDGNDVDRIADFTRADGDTIDLRRVDADSATAGDQEFSFVGGAAFSSTAGELRYELDSLGRGVLSGDTNGDGAADFQIRLENGAELAATDFLL